MATRKDKRVASTLLALLVSKGWRKIAEPVRGRLVTTLSSGPVDTPAEKIAERTIGYEIPGEHPVSGHSILVRYDHPKRGKGCEVICVPEEFIPSTD